MAKKTRWFGNEKRLAQLAKEHSADELAAMFGVALKTVLDTCREFGIEAKTKYKCTTEKLLAALKDDPRLTAPELSAKTGVPLSTIFVRSRNGDIKLFHAKAVKPIDIAEVASMCKTMSTLQIQKALGVGNERLSKLMKANGLVANSQWFNDALRAGSVKHWAHSPENIAKRLEKNALQGRKPYAKPKPSAIHSATETVWPEGLQIQVVKKDRCDDLRNVMARPVYVPGAKTISVRY